MSKKKRVRRREEKRRDRNGRVEDRNGRVEEIVEYLYKKKITVKSNLKDVG